MTLGFEIDHFLFVISTFTDNKQVYLSLPRPGVSQLILYQPFLFILAKYKAFTMLCVCCVVFKKTVIFTIPQTSVDTCKCMNVYYSCGVIFVNSKVRDYLTYYS